MIMGSRMVVKAQAGQADRVNVYNVVRLHYIRMGVMCMERNQFSFSDLIQFGIFLVALLSLIFNMCN